MPRRVIRDTSGSLIHDFLCNMGCANLFVSPLCARFPLANFSSSSTMTVPFGSQSGSPYLHNR